ncbi:hypothetical protein ACLKA6_019811 [Drosophila palustris]
MLIKLAIPNHLVGNISSRYIHADCKWLGECFVVWFGLAFQGPLSMTMYQWLWWVVGGAGLFLLALPHSTTWQPSARSVPLCRRGTVVQTGRVSEHLSWKMGDNS